MLPQQYCLRWKYHHSNLQTMFSQLLDRGSFCDVTLACEGQLIRAHRVVLCACSTFFDTVLSNYASERDPIIIMKDVTFADVRCLIEFMYKGEINVEHAHLATLLKTADDLKIKGLAEVTWRENDDGVPTPPTPTAEFHSPTQESIFPHDHHERSSPIFEGRRTERRSVTPPPIDARKLHSMPTLTPIPASRNPGQASTTSSMEFLGPKRKRGRPPLDDAYDVFNIHKLAHFANHMEHQAYLEAQHYADESRQQAGRTSMSPTSAAAVYQHHVQQQQSKQRLRHRPKRISSTDNDHDESLNPGPEWINSNLEVNISEATSKADDKKSSNETESCKSSKEEKLDKGEPPKKSEHKRRQRSLDNDHSERYERPQKRKNSQTEQRTNSTTSHKQHSDGDIEKPDKEQTEEQSHETDTVPQPVEEIESVKQVLEHQQQQQQRNEPETSVANSTSRQSSPISSTRRSSNLASSSTSSSSLPPPQPGLQHPHFGKFAPEGYLLNEHGMLMTHDSFVHAPTASIPVAAGTSTSANGSDQEFVDIKMEDFDAADLRLTSEEMSQWQDVIKMDDYLAKGRRPQFWEEPFTRRVLDAIKNKRLEMKKAARILGVSYGTLYGRYREVYGCLKHPYSNSSGYRPSSSQLAIQPRFDMVWPTSKRESAALLPGPLDIGKLRPKDLSELWARPQI